MSLSSWARPGRAGHQFTYDQNGTPDDGDYATMVDFGYTHEVGHRNDQWCDLVYDTLT